MHYIKSVAPAHHEEGSEDWHREDEDEEPLLLNEIRHKKLITIDDIQLETITKANGAERSKKIEAAMIEFDDRREPEDYEILMNMIEYKIEEHLSRVEYQMLLMSDVEYQIMEKELIDYFKTLIDDYEEI